MDLVSFLLTYLKYICIIYALDYVVSDNFVFCCACGSPLNNYEWRLFYDCYFIVLLWIVWVNYCAFWILPLCIDYGPITYIIAE